jgi:hypothetical protein
MGRRCLAAVLGWAVCCAQARSEDAQEAFFELKIRPVLATTCLPCHGGKATKSGLRVDSRASLLEGGNRGAALVAGNPRQSLLLRAIKYDDDELKMPPKKRLPAEVAAAFEEWISRGAAWPEKPSAAPTRTDVPNRHWAFQRIKGVEPAPDLSGWSISAIDRFIASRQRAAGLKPVRGADKRTLIRRLSFDLIGMPPTPAEMHDFLADTSPGALAHVVDRLLASPRYGQRWGRHWMDVVRYADTAGDNADYPIPEIVRYRDYIIASFNKDKPYDEFVREQLAGDILARQRDDRHYADAVVATGFLALARRYATAPFELWHLTLEDAIETTGRTFLGLSLRCARCHDHKYDPVTQRDYYGLYGVFASTAFPYAGSEEFHSKKFPRMNFAPVEPPARAESKLKAHEIRLARLQAEIKTLRAASNPPPASRRRLGEMDAEWTRLKNLGLPPDLPGAYAVSEGKPVDAGVQRRGEPGNDGPVVRRGAPAFPFLDAAPPEPAPQKMSGRLELANWLTQPGHPLTVRVMANRVWQYHFGRGIVATSSNFGARGEPPSHPELLDWLSTRLVASGWSIKALHREIVLSHTYQLSSEFDSRNAAIDPEDRLLWNFPRRRLDAESIRDAMLGVSGLLDERTPAGHPFPPIDRWHWTQHDPFKAEYPTNRRSVYLMTQRLVKHPFLAIFDGPDANTSTEARSRSTVPTQALFLLNNPFVQACASGLARRLAATSAEPCRQIEAAYPLAWGRPPAPDETRRAATFLAAYRASLLSSGAPAQGSEVAALAALSKAMLTANEFLYID